MSDHFAITSSQPPDAVIAALAARGCEWRESTLPAALRQAGVFGVQVELEGRSFVLRGLGGSRNPMRPVCRGRVRAAPAGGSQIEARLGPGLAVWGLPVAYAGLFAAVGRWTDGSAFNWGLVVGGLGLGGVILLVAYLVATGERTGLREVVTAAAGVEHDEGAAPVEASADEHSPPAVP